VVAGRDAHDARVELAQDVEQGNELGAVCEAARDGLAVDAAVRGREAGREPDSACA
jgi:hypothetical protein